MIFTGGLSLMACAEPLRSGRRDRLPFLRRKILILRAFASGFRGRSARPEGML